MKKWIKEAWRRLRQKRLEVKRRKYQKHAKPKKTTTKNSRVSSKQLKRNKINPEFVDSPRKLSIINNASGCVSFFANIRAQAIKVKNIGKTYVPLNISDIDDIDLPATMVLSALGRELKVQNVNLSGNFPNNPNCFDFFVKTGFLNDKVDSSGVRFNKSEKTDYFTINKGNRKLSVDDTIVICNIVKHACDYTGSHDSYDDVVSIIKEIAGNSIEWSHSLYGLWNMGVMFEDEGVTFSILDLGRGILDSINRRISDKIKGLFSNDIDFLIDVFDKHYSSKSNEINRYKGLPSIKKAYLDGRIQNLSVMTNNVLLFFDDYTRSVQFSKSHKAFNGTLYYWTIKKRNQ